MNRAGQLCFRLSHAHIASWFSRVPTHPFGEHGIRLRAAPDADATQVYTRIDKQPQYRPGLRRPGFLFQTFSFFLSDCGMIGVGLQKKNRLGILGGFCSILDFTGAFGKRWDGLQNWESEAVGKKRKGTHIDLSASLPSALFSCSCLVLLFSSFFWLRCLPVVSPFIFHLTKSRTAEDKPLILGKAGSGLAPERKEDRRYPSVLDCMYSDSGREHQMHPALRAKRLLLMRIYTKILSQRTIFQ